MPAIRRSEVQLKVSVDPNIASFKLFGNLGGPVEIRRPHRGPKTVICVVCFGDGFLVGAETQ